VRLLAAGNPVSAENPVTSCDVHVFVDEAAEPISPERPDGRAGRWRSAARGWALIERSVRAVRVEVLDVLAQDDVEVAWSGDASDLLDVDQAAGSAAHSVPRATVDWLGCFLPPSGWLTHSVPPAVARPRRG
jgi:hypothetical protein